MQTFLINLFRENNNLNRQTVNMTCMMYVETNVDKCIMNTKHWLLKEEENVTP